MTRISRTRTKLKLGLAAIAATAFIAAACGDDNGDSPTPTDEPSPTTAPTATEENDDEPTPTPEENGERAELPDGPYQQSPWWPYLSAHINDDSPREVAGGPITVTATQEEGTVNWVLPGPRELDPAVFGTPDNPKGTEMPPMVLGVPEEMRTIEDGTYTTSQPTPFSDNAQAVTGSVDVTVVDATATDAAVTDDEIDFTATFTAPGGQGEYEITVDQPAPHGWFIPTGGGVVTNFIQHGVTGWGSRLMPTEYDDFAFWGMGTVTKNGEVIAENRVVHVMLTEFVRGENYSLVHDQDVNPGARHLHVMMAPFDPFGNQEPVPTGFELPNGQEQPFFHIMYPGVTAEAKRPGFDGELPDSIAGIEQSSLPGPAAPPDGPYQQSPWWPYVSAHIDDEQPRDVLGGPLAIQATQEEGTVNWVLPGPRELDPAVFGTPDNPKGTEMPPMVLGVPEEMRTTEDGAYMTSQPTPFSDNAQAVTGAVDVTVVDATSTDAAVTRDQIDFTATFTAPGDQGEYEITVDQPAPHGWFIPTGGGVVTNFIQHGVTGWGSRLMPTEYDDFAFWGMGTVTKDGEVIAENRVVHVMLTEFVRGENYSLVHDQDVNPGARHLHVMMAPFDPFGNQEPVPTDFELPNGQEQPFFHIMYPGVSIDAAGSVSAE